MSDSVDFKWYGDDWKRIVNRAVEETLNRTAFDIMTEATKGAPVGVSGNLRRSIAFQKAAPDGRIMTAWVGFAGGHKDAFKYAMAVEKGRKPGKPPPTEALMLWVERVLHVGQSKSKTTGKYRKTSTQASKRVLKSGLTARESEIKSVAYLVARKIGRDGTKAQPFLLPAYDMYANTIGNRLTEQMEELKGYLPK